MSDKLIETLRDRDTVAEVARRIDRSPAWVRRHLRKLEAAGLIRIEKHKKTHVVEPRDNLFGGAARGVHYELVVRI